ncbi:MAG TPA: PfkB family carbohydrate kinase, partial [Planctomycetota bacterium]|nr:PfkB family carbohydrate kinase [Planctomycetota bacterium]
MRPPRPPSEIARELSRFEELSVVVVGDFFIDEYIEGVMTEISREGPIPVIRYESRRRAAGAAGNLASSIRNLGAKVYVVGMVGGDANGGALRAELDKKGIETSGLLVCEDQPTFTYTKIRARVPSSPSREILRLDVLPVGP